MSSVAILNPGSVELTQAGESRPFPEKKRVVTINQEGAVPTISARMPTKKLKARSTRVRLGVIHSPELRISKAIPVEVQRKGDSVLAIAVDLQEFGCGETMSDALDDLSKGLAELFFRLEEDGARLGSDLISLRTKLARYVERRSKE